MPTVVEQLVALRAQALRFVSVGAFIMVLYLAVTAALSELARVPFQLAVAIGYFTGVCVHFLLHRGFVFASEDGYALSIAGQVVRFVILVAVQYGLTATAVAVLPGLLDIPRQVAWLAAVGVVTPVSFVLLRTRLFHPAPVGVTE